MTRDSKVREEVSRFGTHDSGSSKEETKDSCQRFRAQRAKDSRLGGSGLGRIWVLLAVHQAGSGARARGFVRGLV